MTEMAKALSEEIEKSERFEKQNRELQEELDDEKLTSKVRLQMYNTAEEARKDLERFVEDLKNQIQKMKCCGNCMGLIEHSFQRIHCSRCKNRSDWRLAE